MVKRGTRGPLQKAKGCGLIANFLGGMHGLNLSSGVAKLTCQPLIDDKERV